MAGINNIIGAYNINPKRLSSKLSFEMGQVFAAKIVSVNELNSELILKLMDGWQFPAQLENPLGFIPETLVKFQVDGFKDGKLQLKIIKDKAETEENVKNSIENLINNSNSELDKRDYSILKKMIQHNMPLTKDNISKIKTIVDFKNKIEEEPDEEDKFTTKYLKSKAIDINSENGKNISKTLKGFFNELKNVSTDEILSMIENNIDLTEENIKSFVKISREEGVLYKEIKELNDIRTQVLKEGYDSDLKSVLKENSPEEKDNFSIKIDSYFKEIDNFFNKTDSSSKEAQNIVTKNLKEQSFIIEEGEVEAFSLEKLIEKDLGNIEGVKPIEKEVYTNTKKIVENAALHISVVKDEELLRDINRSNDSIEPIKLQEENSKTLEREHPKAINDIFKEITKLDKNEVENFVKEQLSRKMEDMKTIVKALIEDKKNSFDEYSKVFQGLKEFVNDFKIFNSISNQYYLIDVPINLNKDDYQCKLLIKDDRKANKKIDSKNVNLVVSVKTMSIGIVDAYVKVKEYNMTIDLKCEEPWVKILSAGKNKLLQELSSSKYNVYMNVDKREKEATLVNCSDFFDDNNLNSINIRV